MMYEQINLIRDIFGTREYDERCALIEAHLDEIDEETVEAFEMLMSQESLSPPERWVMANLCARTLSQASLIHAQQGNSYDADRFAEYSLEAFQRAFYMPGELGLEDCADMTASHLRLLLAFAGDLRLHGMEDRAWQAYWIVDPIFSAMDSVSTISDLPVAQMLEAANLLEQAGMKDKSEALRKKARQLASSTQEFTRENKLAKKLFSVPTRLPEPDVYLGETTRTAIRFASQEVGVRCVQQTRCPRCHGPLKYVSKSLVGSSGNKVYDKYTLECENNTRHSAVTLYKDASKEPLMAQLGPALAGLMEKADQEKKSGSFSSPSVSYPTRKDKRIFNLIRAIFTVLITAAASMVASLLAWGTFRLFWETDSFWRVLLGNLAGAASGFGVFFMILILISIPAVLFKKDLKPSALITLLSGIAGIAVGGYVGYRLAGQSGLASLLVLAVVYWLLKLYNNRLA